MTSLLTPARFESLAKGTMTDSRFPGFVFNLGGDPSTEEISTVWKDGIPNPNWRVQVLRNVDAATPYSVRRVRFQPAYSDIEARSSFSSLPEWPSVRVKSRFYTRNLTCKELIEDVKDEDLREIALRRLKQRLSSDVGNFQALAPLVELREMRGLIRTSADLTTGLVKSLVDIKRTKGKSAFKYASDAWLNWSFGISPTISDTKKLAQSIAVYLHRSDRKVRLVGSASRTWHSSLNQYGMTGPYGVDMSYHASGVHSLSYKYTGGVSLRMANAVDYGVAEHFGLVPSSLPSVAWELTAWSWVIDYFTTVGAFLEDAFESPPGDLIYLVLNRKYTFDGMCTIEPGKTYNGTDYRQYRSNVGQLSVRTLEREDLPTIPHLALRFKTVDEIGTNAVNRLLNLTSLLYNMRR